MKSRNESLELLQGLIAQKARQHRRTKCLKNPERIHRDKDEWFIYVPSCFNDCLDIAKTDRVETKGHLDEKTQKMTSEKKTKKVWTQGSRFAFHRGCTLYDTPKAYRSWGDAIKEIKYCISIHYGESVKLTKKKRESGNVKFAVLIPSSRTASLEEIGTFELTQDKFVMFLIVGNPQIIPE